jgi:hypothetical protein
MENELFCRIAKESGIQSYPEEKYLGKDWVFQEESDE